MAYPTIANWWNTTYASRYVHDYSAAVSNLSESEYNDVIVQAQAYNALLTTTKRSETDEEMHEMYEDCLEVGLNGIMGSIYIPSIEVDLPIYHGTEAQTLRKGIGHVEGSSLPVGGKGSHAVLSGHRGLPSARLFTDLDQLQIGDYFVITVLNETLTYEVDQIKIVLPTDLSALTIDTDQDYVSLVTCTPYGVNTHRLIVRGHRVSNINYELNITADATQYPSKIAAAYFSVPLALVLVFLTFMQTRKKKEQ
jgi:sortase A